VTPNGVEIDPTRADERFAGEDGCAARRELAIGDFRLEKTRERLQGWPLV
jgi:hypothetical protein